MTGKKTLVTKSSKMMAFVDIEDLYGVMETVVFPNVYERCQDILNEDEVVVMKGKLNFKEGEMPKVLADNIVLIDDPEVDKIAEFRNSSRSSGRSRQEDYDQYGYPGQDNIPPAEQAPDVQPVKVRIPQDSEESEMLSRIKEVIARYPGNTPVYIYLKSGRTIRTGSGGGVRPTAELLSDLGDIVLNRNVKFAGRVQF